MSFLDTLQHWALEIGGFVLFLLALYRVLTDMATGISTFDIFWYFGVFALSFVMMGHKGLARALLGK